MKIQPKDLPENIRKAYQIKNATGGKIGFVFKAVRKNHTTIVIYSKNITKDVWRKVAGEWIKS